MTDRAAGERVEDRREEIDSLRLVERFQRGERAVVEDLYLRYFDRVIGYVRFLRVRSVDVDDVVQQVFAAMLEGLGRYEPRGEASFRSWLLGIARNKAFKHRLQEDRTELREPDAIEELLDALGHHEPGPAAAGWLSGPELMAAVLRLSGLLREVVFLRYADDLSMAEIASATGRTEVAIQQAHSRALRSLRERLQADDDQANRPRRPLAMRQLAWGVRRAMAHSFSPARA
ncbi:MAG: polymerase sigma-70 factor, subfamily [Solirubrobacteraceae bacterium]|nr:polymerase sigma-70 factor, subfamily [Solirubrobacteraceae bacterium]